MSLASKSSWTIILVAISWRSQERKNTDEKFAFHSSSVDDLNGLTRRAFQAEMNVASYEKINRAGYGAVVQCSERRHINAARLHLSNIRAPCVRSRLRKFAKIHALRNNGNAIVVSPCRLVNGIVDDTDNVKRSTPSCSS